MNVLVLARAWRRCATGAITRGSSCVAVARGVSGCQLHPSLLGGCTVCVALGGTGVGRLQFRWWLTYGAHSVYLCAAGVDQHEEG